MIWAVEENSDRIYTPRTMEESREAGEKRGVKTFNTLGDSPPVKGDLRQGNLAENGQAGCVCALFQGREGQSVCQ